MRRLLIASFFMIACAAPAAAQFAFNGQKIDPIPGIGQMVQATAPVAPPVAAPPVAAPPVVAPAVPPQIIVTSPAPPAPAAETASFSVGTWIADLLGGLVAIFGSVIATFLTKWVMAIAKKAGIEATQAMSDRLDDIIKNGLHAGAIEARKDLTGNLNVTTKNEVIARAVQYAQAHGADTIKQISGLDVGDPKTVTALQARAAKALATVGPDVVLTQTTTTSAAPATKPTSIPTELAPEATTAQVFVPASTIPPT